MSDVSATLLVIGGIVIHFVVSVACVFALVSAAYAFSHTAGAEIGSYDELYRLGPSPQACVAGLALCGVNDFIVSLVLLWLPATRSRAWIVPIVGVGLSIAMVVVAVATLHPAVPYVGG